MKFSASATAALVAGASLAESFSVQSSLPRIRQTALLKALTSDEFDSILGEGSSYREAASRFSRKTSTPVVRVPDGSRAATVSLTSSVAAPAEDLLGDDLGLEDELAIGVDSIEGTAAEVSADNNPLLNNEILRRQHEKNLLKEQRKASGGMMKYVKNPLLLIKGKDFSDITITILIPAFVSYLIIKKAAEMAGEKLEEIATDRYETAAAEIAYHAGDIEEVEAIYKQCMKKNWFQGSKTYKGPELFKKTLEYILANKKTSPKTVSTVQYIASLSKMSDEEIAELLLEMCRADTTSTKTPMTVIFYADLILKDKAAKKKLNPIRAILAGQFGDDYDMLKEVLSDVGEQAYREAISDGGKDQTKLTEGWKVLGLSKETATRIFEEKKARGFLNFGEEMIREEQDRLAKEAAREAALREKMANAFDAEGNVIDHGDEEEEEEKDYGPGRKKECLSCGLVIEIFDEKPDEPWNDRKFVCPGCGGPKSNFKSIYGDL